jgi:transposase
VIPGPAACPCCGGKLAKLGETITETLEVVPRQWKVIQRDYQEFRARLSGLTDQSMAAVKRPPNRTAN